jgi:hypothetical protein
VVGGGKSGQKLSRRGGWQDGWVVLMDGGREVLAAVMGRKGGRDMITVGIWPSEARAVGKHCVNR